MSDNKEMAALAARVEELTNQVERLQQQLNQIMETVAAVGEASKQRDERLFGFLFMRRDISVLVPTR